MVHLDSLQLLVQPGEHHGPWPLHMGQHRRGRIQQIRLPGQQIPLFQTVHHALPKFHLHRLALFPQPGRFIQKKEAVFLRKIIQEGHRILRKIPQIVVQPAQLPALADSVHQLRDHTLDPVGFLALVLAAESLLTGCGLLLQLCDTRLELLPGQHHLGGRIDGHLLQLLHGPLALHVKGADRVYLVVPHLDADRNLLGQGVNVHDAAPDGKLSHSVHLGPALVAHGGQTVPQLFQVQHLSLLHGHDLIAHVFEGQKVIHQSVHGGHHNAALILHQMPQHADPLAGHQIAMDVRAVEQQILSRIEHHIFCKIPEIVIDFLGPGVVIGDHQLPREMQSVCRQVLPQFVHEMHLLGIQRSRHLKGPPALFQGLRQIFIFLQFQQWILHGLPHLSVKYAAGPGWLPMPAGPG